jgi:hypothetical protein
MIERFIQLHPLPPLALPSFRKARVALIAIYGPRATLVNPSPAPPYFISDVMETVFHKQFCKQNCCYGLIEFICRYTFVWKSSNMLPCCYGPVQKRPRDVQDGSAMACMWSVATHMTPMTPFGA